MLPRDLLKEVRKIEIKTNRLVDSVYAGGYKSVFKGRGLEFAGIRQYYRGDEFKSIDWKTSARSGRFQVREHVEEREIQVIIALDLSASMAFGTGSREKRETAVEFGAAMALAAARNNDRVGICLFTDRVEKFIGPAKGKTHILHVIRELLYFIPENKASDPRPALGFLNKSLNRRSVVFFVTDGIDLPEITRELHITSEHHDVIAGIIHDKRELDILDVGMIEVEDPETGDEWTLDTSDRTRIEAFLGAERARIEAFRSSCNRMGVATVDLTAGESVVRPICRLFAEREKRLKH